MTNSPSVDLSLSPQAFFHERVANASHQLKIDLSQEVEFYLVNLLTEFINPAHLNEEFNTDVLSTPLVFLLKRTVEAPEAKRPGMYRRLGDTSLYMCGFFQDYFNDKTFDINYFITMGASAYNQAAILSKPQNKEATQQNALSKISENFGQIVDVVAQASDAPGRPMAKDILHIYDRWNRSGSARLRNILLENGITPISTPYKIAQ